uniref:Pathogenesis-related protein 1 n=1 Tax=Moniliophthora perniciosa TaxID=153609 RepID=A0A8E7D5D6_MONPR|nr:pathogenesis-related protein 1 [Moniliophthora perniciosa]QVT77553.1 pathogenesis-related protein 1 [Moniliophthora perniciosa]
MQFKPLLAFISLSQLLSLASAAPAAELEARQSDWSDIQEWLFLHNEERRANGVGFLSWDYNLVYQAQEVAKQCNVDNPQLHGENGASFNIGRYSKEQAFTDWKNTASLSGDGSIPWQRIVWPDTWRVGCAQADCQLEFDVLYTVQVCLLL